MPKASTQLRQCAALQLSSKLFTLLLMPLLPFFLCGDLLPWSDLRESCRKSVEQGAPGVCVCVCVYLGWCSVGVVSVCFSFFAHMRYWVGLFLLYVEAPPAS